MRVLLYLFVVSLLAAAVLFTSAFIVPEGHEAVVTEFGKPIRIILGRTYNPELVTELKKDNIQIKSGPNVYFRVPFLQDVALFDSRACVYTAQAKDIVTHDKQKIFVDNYAVWRIENPQKFFITVHDQQGALQRLDDFVYAIVRDNLSKYDLSQIVRTTIGKKIEGAELNLTPIAAGGRDNILADITNQCREQARTVGISILDVRIRRADLPKENEQAVFARMVEERTRISRKYRAAGNERLESTKAQADQDVQRILAEAERDAQLIRGDADAATAKIYADAFATNKDFYIYMKSLEVFEKSVDADTKAVINPDKTIFRFLKGRD